MTDPVYPLDLPASRRRYTFNGSAALYAALLDSQLERGAAVLLPAYCCGAELGPFEQLGCTLFFYDINADFSIRREEVARILRDQPDIRVLLLTHYLGLAQPDVEAIAELCRSSGVCLIEDCAHALYTEDETGRPLGQSGDYAIFSMRKSLPLSEGGAVVGKQELQAVSLRPPSRSSSTAWLSRVAYSFQQGARSGSKKGLSRLLAGVSIIAWTLPAVLAKVARRTGLQPASDWLTPDVEGAAAQPVYGQGMSAFSHRLLMSADGQQIRRRRRANHAHWVRQVAQIDGVEPVHQELPEGACPLYFVARVSNPGQCVKLLEMSDIEAFNWWQHLSSCIVWSDFPIARQYKQSLLALPLHQQLQESDITHMATCLSVVVDAGRKDS